jgi:hypothetical protein
MLAWRDLYFLDEHQYFLNKEGDYVEPSESEVRIVLPTAQYYVEGMREMLLTKRPAIDVPPPTNSGQDMLDADHNEKALVMLWDMMNVYEQLGDATWHGLTDGWGVLQLLYDKDHAEDEAPLILLSHDPYNVYAAPGKRPGTWEYVLHAYPRFVLELQDEWPDNEGLQKMDPDKQVTFIDYWDDKVNAIGISYTEVRSGFGETTVCEWLKEPAAHGYGFFPWEIFFPCRLPFRKIGERMGISVFHFVTDLIRYQCDLVSKKATMIQRHQDPPLVTKTLEGRSFEPISSEHGMHIRLFPEESAEYLVYDSPMPALDTQISLMQDFIERGSIPRGLQGQGGPGEASGMALSMLRNPTLMRVAFKQSAIERCLQSLNSKILRLIEKKVKKPFTAFGIDSAGMASKTIVDPQKIGQYYYNRVRLSASLPTDDASTVQMLSAMIQTGLISRQTGRDVMQNTLHEILPQSLPDEQVRVITETVLENPEFINSLAMQAAQDLFLPIMQQGKQEGAAAQGPQQNPMGGYGQKEVTMPSTTMASQQPGMAGGNTKPSLEQILGESSGGMGGM